MGERVKVLYFGAAAEVAGKKDEEWLAADSGALRRQLLEKYPAMAAVRFRMALNSTLLREETRLRENDVIAILPPFQGG